MEYDELELDTLGEEKTALFVIISDTDATFNFVVSIMYSRLFNLLCDKADDVYNGRLPVHVRMLLDEFANIGQIPQFEKLIATIRSREISASIILQSKSQLKAIYKDNADTIEGNCDTTLFLGGKEKTTLKELAEVLGKETIDLYDTSDTRGASQYRDIVADAGYESEENYLFIEENGQTAYIKPSNYERSKKARYRNDIGRAENMIYDEEENCYVCHNGKKLDWRCDTERTSKTGYTRVTSKYTNVKSVKAARVKRTVFTGIIVRHQWRRERRHSMYKRP